jgi:hypothetical protein
MELHHDCRKKACCNPGHLWLLTAEEHARVEGYRGLPEVWIRRRGQRLCKRGHSDYIRDSRGRRSCRTCKVELQRLRRRHAPTP